MTTATVTTQAELDAALDRTDLDEIIITSPAGVWLELDGVWLEQDRSGSASVTASGSASVRASGSASVTASGSASVTASPHVAVHLHSARERHDMPTTYTVGATVTAPDWRDDHECGGGLHASPRPEQAKRYRDSETGTRFLRVAAPLVDLRPISADKAKTRSVRVLAEVDIHATDLTPANA
jgi:hypothetical protein